MKRFQILVFLTFLTCGKILSQEHEYNIGLRTGKSGGITFRHFLTDEKAFEGILRFYDKGFKFTILKESILNSSFSFSDNFYFIKGIGAHAGIIKTDNFEHFGDKYYMDKEYVSPAFGLDGLLGFEYKFYLVPIVVGLDWKPFFEFSRIQYFRLEPWDIGFSIRYAF